jgi:cytosine/creatinine deaminase
MGGAGLLTAQQASSPNAAVKLRLILQTYSASFPLRSALRTLRLPSAFETRGTVNASKVDHLALLKVAIDEARKSLAEGGIPIGAAIFDNRGQLVGAGHNRRVQDGDPSLHAETDAFRNAGRQRSYRDLIMVTTLAPCWYCSGLVRQFGFGTVIVGESRNFQGGIDWLISLGVRIIDLDSEDCVTMLASYIAAHPEIWHEDIGLAE